MLTQDRINTYFVLLFTDSKKAQIYKLPYRNSSQREIEILMSFDYLHVFGLDENKKDGNFLFEIEKKYILMWEKNYLVLKQTMILKNIFHNMVITMLNSHLIAVKKTFTSCYIKNTFLLKNIKIRQ